MEPTRHHIFLSHNSDDKPLVEILAQRLKQEGIEPWLDSWHLIPGDPFQPAIEEALKQCDGCAVFFGPGGVGPWQNEEMQLAIGRRVEQKGFRVIPVLLPGAERGERSRLPGFLTQTIWVKFHKTLDDDDNFHRLLSGIRGVSPGPGRPAYQGECPYRSLTAFQPQDARLFFGREALTDWLLTALRKSRFAAITGASGSGKSSLALAGLVPAIKRNRLEGSDRWRVVIFKPGADPIESLAIALAADDVVGARVDVGTLSTQLLQEPNRLHLTTRVALHGGHDSDRVFILVDQFEEVFTLCFDEHKRKALIDNLLHATRTQPGRTVVVLTMRADFYGKCAAYGELAAAMSDHPFLVGGMTEPELRNAIVRPAQLSGCELDPGLTEILVAAVSKQAGALPLLQHALTRLWEQREGDRLTVDAYNRIGKLEGALEQWANAVFDKLGDAGKAACRRIFLRLTEPGEGTEDTKRRSSLAELGRSEEIGTVVQALADARLITTEGGAAEADRQTPEDAGVYVEVAHEALIRGWSKLRGWLDEDREALRIHHRLSEAANQWDKEGRDRPEGYVYRGTPLQQAEEWEQSHPDALNELEQEFLDLSKKRRDEALAREKRLQQEKEQQRKRELQLAKELAEKERLRAEEVDKRRQENEESTVRLKKRAWLLVVVAVIAVIAAGWAWLQKEEAMHQTEKANFHLAKAFEEKALHALDVASKSKRTDDYRKAWLYALEAQKIPIPAEERALEPATLGAFLDPNAQQAFAQRWFSPALNLGAVISSVAYSPDGRTLASGL